MTLWLDAQLPPMIAGWITEEFGVASLPVRNLGLRGAEDEVIYQAARVAEAVIMTKDADFVDLLDRLVRRRR